MKKSMIIFVCVCFAFSSEPQWQAGSKYDLAPQEVVVGQTLKAPSNGETEAISLMMPIERMLISDSAGPYVARSREYRMTVTADELVGGVAIDVTDAGALIRVHAVSPDSRSLDQNAAIDPERLVLVTNNDQVYENGRGFDLLVTAEQMAASDSPFPQGTSAFRLRNELGAGRFWLYADGLDRDAKSSYMVHVFEKGSDTQLSLQASHFEYYAGSSIRLESQLESGRGSWLSQEINAVLRSPEGQIVPLNVTAKSGQLSLSATLPTWFIAGPGLWEAELDVVGNLGALTVRRHVRTAFAVSVATAKFDGRVSVKTEKADAIQLQMGLEIGTPARYEVRGVLYGHNSEGQLEGFALLNSAALFSPGKGWLNMPISTADLFDSGLKAPYQVRDLMLINQDAMQVVQRMANGFSFDAE